MADARKPLEGCLVPTKSVSLQTMKEDLQVSFPSMPPPPLHVILTVILEKT